MRFTNTIAAVVPLLALAAAAPLVTPEDIGSGTHGNQGAHVGLTKIEAPKPTGVANSTAVPSSTAVYGAPAGEVKPGPQFGNTTVTSGANGPQVENPAALAFFSPDPEVGSGGRDPATYTCLSGPASNFPPIEEWTPFETMFKINQPQLALFEPEALQQNIKDSVLKISAFAKVDARLVMAQIMQESTGNVNVPCTNNGVQNCGLMQAFIGSVSFDPTRPAESIEQMIKDGTQGTAQGGGLVQILNDASTGGNVYVALRKYNSGVVDESNLSLALGATASYVSDMANRLVGWDGASRAGCVL
ncbi:MAG: hypothetical protein M1832_000172 [Thelocarpon impressellum]|nr:MAG: hypothetical protein M1832_000172 [Thelocarpon impressellum]